MQTLHELEKRAEVHRLEALKKIEALSQPSSQEQELGPVPSADGPADPTVLATSVSHQQH